MQFQNQLLGGGGGGGGPRGECVTWGHPGSGPRAGATGSGGSGGNGGGGASCWSAT